MRCRSSSSGGILVSIALMIAVLATMGNNHGTPMPAMVSAEMEATWTPNEDEGPAMPLSMNQRQQLVQLQQAISNSPDPNGTLQQVAQSNNMSPNDLYEMIEKNARDLQQDPALLSELQQFSQSNGGGGRGIGNSIPKTLLKMVAALGMAIRQAAHQNPRAFSITAVAALLVFYTLLAIPRTGLQISSGRNILTLSSGPTTVFSPPDAYLHKLIGKTAFSAIGTSPKLSIKTPKNDWDDLLKPMIRELTAKGPSGIGGGDDDDEARHGRVETHKLGRKHELKQAITAQFVLEPDTLLKEFPLGETVEELAAERDNILDMLYSNAAGLLAERNLSEFSAATATKARERLRLVCGGDDGDDGSNDFGVVVVPGLGNLGRHGLVFWRATSETSQKVSSTNPSSTSTLTLTTLKGKGFFDGQIHFDVRKIPQHDGLLLVQVSLAVPRGGRKLSAKTGDKLVEAMARSVVLSASRRTKQRLSRQMQGRRFKDVGSRRATDRRNTRFERERLLEEMATDRRRRWQKSNPDAGRYRPSGDRMRSPNNC
mmetsp:Transcript_101191/g.205323  ORF Transcript_101191/g.205323 Transcript_101191/m.205323 type:complete len:541 (+) Transcript_101191:218-1840(+)